MLSKKKGVFAGKRQVMDGPSRIINQACARFHRPQACKGLGTTSSWVQALLQDSAVREPRYTLSWLANWKSQCRSTNACRSQQQATWHRDLHGRLSHKALVWSGVHGQAGWLKDCTWRQWSPQSHNLQPDHGDRRSHTCNIVVGLPAWGTDYTCHHSHRLTEHPAKGGIWNGLHRLAHRHAVFGYKDFCGSTVLGTPE